MANSPLIARSTNTPTQSPFDKTKLKLAQNGSKGAEAPKEVQPVKEVAEELNEEMRAAYVKDKKVGQGTYANVYLGHLARDPSQLVAIKKIKVNTDYQDGLAVDAIREVKFLQELSHPNIIALHSIFSSKNQNLNLVLEYLPLGDLEMMIKDKSILYTAADMKAWMGMLCRAIWFCHENYVLHRDIKPNNLLIAADGEMKLADFGLARSFADPGRRMTHQVITLWYRPPELLYRARHYSGAVDMWSVGTVFAELVLRTPYLPGMNEIDQLGKISEGVGTPTEDNWPGVTQLEGYLAPEKEQIRPVLPRKHYETAFVTAGSEGPDLIMAMLRLDPRKRITARETLMHPYWRKAPQPTKKEQLPRKESGDKDKKLGEDLRRRGGELESEDQPRIARKLNFGAS